MDGKLTLSDLKIELYGLANPEKAIVLSGFFKTGPGEYGEGDIFLGITVPPQRALSKKYYPYLSLSDIEFLLQMPEHECRLTSLFILIEKYKRAKNSVLKEKITDLYLNNTAYINNWDLVDLSAPNILGHYFLDKDKSVLYSMAQSGNLWKERIAILSTFHFIRNGMYEHTLAMAEIFISHKHDLIHKATGWMVREVGKRDFDTAFEFVRRYYKNMPRTMLRYAIEKYDEPLRKKILEGNF